MNKQRFGHKPVEDFIRFKDAGPSKSGKTKIWWVVNETTGQGCGHIRWHGAWRKYVYDTEDGGYFDWEFLRLVADFIEAKTLEHRHRRTQVSIIAEQDIANKRIIQEAERNPHGPREPNERVRRV